MAEDLKENAIRLLKECLSIIPDELENQALIIAIVNTINFLNQDNIVKAKNSIESNATLPRKMSQNLNKEEILNKINKVRSIIDKLRIPVAA